VQKLKDQVERKSARKKTKEEAEKKRKKERKSKEAEGRKARANRLVEKDKRRREKEDERNEKTRMKEGAKGKGKEVETGVPEGELDNPQPEGEQAVSAGSFVEEVRRRSGSGEGVKVLGSKQAMETDKEKEKREKKETRERQKMEKREKKKEEAKKKSTQDKVLDAFTKHLSGKSEAKVPKQEPEELFDISREIELIREVKDIQEELNILGNLFHQQKLVLEPFVALINEAKPFAESQNTTVRTAPALAKALDRHIDYVDKIEASTVRPYRYLEDLLDLKQKQANVFEARTTRVSGNSITVFTVITIIFLPASFMVAFLALPIQDFPYVAPLQEGTADQGGDDKLELGFAVKYTVTVTVAVSIPFIIFALYVNPILKIANGIRRPVVRAWRLLNKAGRYGALISMGLAKGLQLVGGYVVALVRLRYLWSCIKWVAMAIWRLKWSRVYGWVKRMNEAELQAAKDGVEWRKRHYVLRWLFGKRDSEKKSRGEGEGDVEEGMGSTAVRMSSSYHESRSTASSASDMPLSGEGEVYERHGGVDGRRRC